MSIEDKMTIEEKEKLINNIKNDLCAGISFSSIDDKYFNGNGLVQFIDRNYENFKDIKFKKRS
ncbi:hypothetical protein [Fusobacterium mortiferum]|uniref:Uncharacterized protein n=1 Tax=Fusobacterium mortiferum TaxID=850 RepID=A0ABS2G2Z7_FUSMR|nr:hypothetical protein [Fusobacterium mortiferum]MBM6875118.1 hypothetical protein [Fusobacterium mortiferum]